MYNLGSYQSLSPNLQLRASGSINLALWFRVSLSLNPALQLKSLNSGSANNLQITLRNRRYYYCSFHNLGSLATGTLKFSQTKELSGQAQLKKLQKNLAEGHSENGTGKELLTVADELSLKKKKKVQDGEFNDS